MRKFTILIFAAFLGACAAGPDYRRPELQAPDEFISTTALKSTSEAPGAVQFTTEEVEREFWKSFGDAQLDELIEAALATNHELRIATANLRQVRALRGEARLDFAPTVTANAGRTEARASERQLQGLPAAERDDLYYEARFDAAWELDFFGRVRRNLEARHAEVGAAFATVQNAQVSVTAEVARNYFELRGLQRQLAVAQRNADNQRNTVKLTQARQDAGGGTDLDTARAQAQLNSTLAAIPQLEGALQRTIFRLGLLTGAAPAALVDQLTLPGSLPVLPTVQRIGTPEALLRRRPDVQIAERNLAAATARIGVAVTDLFPRVSFLGRLGFNAADSGSLGDVASETYALGPSISWAAFDLGRVYQRIQASRAASDGALARYEQAVLLALEDTEASLTTYSHALARQQHLRKAAQASSRAAELARLRFDGGVANFLDVLDSERTQLQAESELARSETETATALIAVYKALGGGWNLEGQRS